MTSRKISRRQVLRQGALAAAALGLAPRLVFRAAAAESGRSTALVCLFMRGGVDGLNMVVPHGDPAYHGLRPGIGLPSPGNGEGEVLDLDGFFGLHPALAPLMPAFEAGELAAVHACGSPSPTRSHFDAQNYMETGAPDRKEVREGWLNRHLQGSGSDEPPPFRALAHGGATPLALAGAAPVLAISSLRSTRIGQQRDRELLTAAVERMYGGLDDRLGEAARSALSAIETAQALKNTPSPVDYPAGRLAARLRDVATLIRADVGLEIAFLNLGGWDTHDAEASRLNLALGGMAEALAAFRAHLDDRLEDVCLVTLSEFGRTAAENGSGGTDHGHATAMLALGGPVAGGRVYADWPGLAEEQLHEGRDLAVTTDFRTLLAEIVHRHLGNADLASVFPDFDYDESTRLGIIRT